MAIDDNTSYELTGAQVKDLANKIKGKAADNTFVGATSAAPGSKGLVPEPQAGDDTKFLSGNGTWQAFPTVKSSMIDWSTVIPSNFSALDSGSQGWTVFSIGRLKFIWKQITQKSSGWNDFGQIPDECVGSSMIMFQWTSVYGYNSTGYSAAAQVSGGHIYAQVQGIDNSNGGWAFAIFA